jgi:NADPH:quinone reductase-like Zn-dependent oxidoreductase
MGQKMKFDVLLSSNGRYEKFSKNASFRPHGHLRVKTIYTATSTGSEITNLNRPNTLSIILMCLKSPQRAFTQILKGFVASIKKMKKMKQGYRDIGYSAYGVVQMADVDSNFTNGDAVVACGPQAAHAAINDIPQGLAFKASDSIRTRSSYALFGHCCIVVNSIQEVLTDKEPKRIIIFGYGILGQICEAILLNEQNQVIVVDPAKFENNLSELKGWAEVVIWANGSNLSDSELDFLRFGGKLVVLGESKTIPSLQAMKEKGIILVFTNSFSLDANDPEAQLESFSDTSQNRNLAIIAPKVLNYIEQGVLDSIDTTIVKVDDIDEIRIEAGNCIIYDWRDL